MQLKTVLEAYEAFETLKASSLPNKAELAAEIIQSLPPAQTCAHCPKFREAVSQAITAYIKEQESGREIQRERTTDSHSVSGGPKAGSTNKGRGKGSPKAKELRQPASE